MRKIILLVYVFGAISYLSSQVRVGGELQVENVAPGSVTVLMHQEGECVYTTPCTSTSQFLFEGVLPGIYQMEFFCPSTEQSAFTVEVGQEEIYLGIIRLKPAKSSRFEETDDPELWMLSKQPLPASGKSMSSSEVSRLLNNIKNGFKPFEGVWEWKSAEEDSLFRLRLSLQEVSESVQPASSRGKEWKVVTTVALLGCYEYIVQGEKIVSVWQEEIIVNSRDEMKQYYLVGRNGDQDMFPRTARLFLIKNPVGKERGYAFATLLNKENTRMYWDLKGLIKDDREFVLLRKEGITDLPLPTSIVLQKK